MVSFDVGNVYWRRRVRYRYGQARDKADWCPERMKTRDDVYLQRGPPMQTKPAEARGTTDADKGGVVSRTRSIAPISARVAKTRVEGKPTENVRESGVKVTLQICRIGWQISREFHMAL